jgi:hypothetical protein
MDFVIEKVFAAIVLAIGLKESGLRINITGKGFSKLNKV